MTEKSKVNPAADREGRVEMNQEEKKAIIEMIEKSDDIEFIRLIAKVVTTRVAMEDAILEIPADFVLPPQ